MRSRGPVLLGETPVFPPVAWADENGLLAVGGGVTPEWLLAAYPRGIFPWPWYEETPMLWWAPDPRFVLLPDELHVPRSLRPRLRDPDFAVRFDTCFEAVMRGCAGAPRPGDEGTWITEAMIAGYTSLHERGCAVSAECFVDGELAGGVYGVRLGGAFFGESMFHRVPDASKVAFVALVRRLAAEGGTLLDCQQDTPHLARFGARNIPRAEFQQRLAAAL